MTWFVYMLKCSGERLYTGVTNDLERRFKEHQEGMGGRFTRANRPEEMVHHERYSNESVAKSREAQIKSWPRGKKLALIAGGRGALKSG